MVAYLGYTLRMKTLFCGWPVMVDDTHTRRREVSDGRMCVGREDAWTRYSTSSDLFTQSLQLTDSVVNLQWWLDRALILLGLALSLLSATVSSVFTVLYIFNIFYYILYLWVSWPGGLVRRTASDSTLTSQRWSFSAPLLRSATNITTVDVAGSTLPVASKLQSLGVTIDSNLQFDCHARNVAKTCNFHTRALRHVRSLLTDDVAQTVACSIVASRLDYCNALSSGAPAATFDKLQRAQNNLARVAPTPGRCFTRYTGFSWGSGSPTNWLYWLTRCGPQPLQRISVSWYRPVHHLGFCALLILRCSSFLAYTPNWPVALFLLLLHLPGTLYLLRFDCENILTFKRHLKTHLFKLT